MADPVDTFRRISWIIFKWILWALAGVVALVASAIAVFYFHNWYTYQRHVEKVTLTVSTERDKCKEDQYPLRVFIGNLSTRTLIRVDFTLAAKIKGRSTDIARYHSYSDDHVIEPKRGYSACWSVPPLDEQVEVKDPRELEWSFQYTTLRFQD